MERKMYLDNIERDEIKFGYLVTTQQKKAWNVQLNLIVEFARICQKHNLKWFAYAGTLLGAVRHKGFVPWDDDVDLAMFRPDYERLKKVIVSELAPEYSADFWYDYAFEGERNPQNLPMLSRAVFESNAWWPSTACYFKIRDERTSMIEWADRPNVKQGIGIDIFPLDPTPPFNSPQHLKQFKAVTELMLAVSSPKTVADALNKKDPLVTDRKFLKALLKKPFRERALEYEKFLADHFFESEYVAHINSIFAYRRAYDWRREYWNELVELPFEKFSLPAPRGYEQVLTAHYGNWHELIRTHSHNAITSADIPYREYFASIAPRG